MILLTAKGLCACEKRFSSSSFVQNASSFSRSSFGVKKASKHEKKYSELFFFFSGCVPVESQFPKQGSNSGHGGESQES